MSLASLAAGLLSGGWAGLLGSSWLQGAWEPCCSVAGQASAQLREAGIKERDCRGYFERELQKLKEELQKKSREPKSWWGPVQEGLHSLLGWLLLACREAVLLGLRLLKCVAQCCRYNGGKQSSIARRQRRRRGNSRASSETDSVRSSEVEAARRRARSLQ